MSPLRKVPIVLRSEAADVNCIRVRLDENTTILLKNMQSFTSWKARYPNAEVIGTVASDKKTN